jgi:hypothetical protein
LWLISNRYDVPAKSIIKWNHLFNAIKGLQIGQKLIIWHEKSAFLPLALFLATALFTLPGPEL